MRIRYSISTDLFFMTLAISGLLFSRDFFFGYPIFLISWFFLKGVFLWRFEKTLKDDPQLWLYKERWNKALFMILLPSVAFQLPLPVWLWEITLLGESMKSMPTVIFSVPLWPIFLFLWFIRDKNKERDQLQRDQEIDQSRLTTNQDDFHKIQEWAADQNQSIPLRIAAIHQMLPFLTGENTSDELFKEKFQVATIELFKAILFDLPERFLEELTPEDQQEVLEEKRRIFGEDYQAPTRLERLDGDTIRHSIETVIERSFKVEKEDKMKAIRKKIDFVGLNFGSIALVNVNLSEMNLGSTHFMDGGILASYLVGCDFSKAEFVDVSLNQTHFDYSDLSETKFIRCDLSGAYFDSVNLEKASIEGCTVVNTSFRFSNLRNLDLADLQGWGEISDISGANIQGVQNAPEDFVAWAKERGAVEMEPEEWAHYQDTILQC